MGVQDFILHGHFMGVQDFPGFVGVQDLDLGDLQFAGFGFRQDFTGFSGFPVSRIANREKKTNAVNQTSTVTVADQPCGFSSTFKRCSVIALMSTINS